MKQNKRKRKCDEMGQGDMRKKIRNERMGGIEDSDDKMKKELEKKRKKGQKKVKTDKALLRPQWKRQGKLIKEKRRSRQRRREGVSNPVHCVRT